MRNEKMEDRKTENEKKLFVTRFTAWSPGMTCPEDWREWADGKRALRISRESPELSFTDPRFRRRLSQVSRMTIQVLRDLTPIGEDTKIVFLSFWGELTSQFRINEMLITEGEISPSAFPVSVFNTPPAAASIALNITAGYTAVYPCFGGFSDGFTAGAASVLCGDAGETVMVYADELCPPAYEGLCEVEPLAFGFRVSRFPEGLAIPVAVTPGPSAELATPQSFLRYLLSAEN